MKIAIGGRQQTPEQIAKLEGVSIREAALLAAISPDTEAGLIARGLLAIEKMFMLPIKVLTVGTVVYVNSTEKQNVDAILLIRGVIFCFEIKRIPQDHNSWRAKYAKLHAQAEHGRQILLQSGLKAQKIMAAVDAETMYVSIDREVWYRLPCPKVNFTSLLKARAEALVIE
jgi:preprotein translocase subunit YajC